MINDYIDALRNNGVEIEQVQKNEVTGQLDIQIQMLFNLNPRQKKKVEEIFQNEVWPKGYKTMKFRDKGFKYGTRTTISYLKTKS